MSFLRCILWSLLVSVVLSINPYQVLGLSRSSGVTTINRALRKMVTLYKDDSKMLTLLKQAYAQIKMYQLLDRGVYQPKKRPSKLNKAKLKLRLISPSDYVKWTMLIFSHLVPVTFLIYCLFQKPKKKIKDERLSIDRSSGVPATKPVEKPKQQEKRESIPQRRIRIVRDVSYFQETNK